LAALRAAVSENRTTDLLRPGAAQVQPGGICDYYTSPWPVEITQPQYCSDGYIAKLKADGTLIYATYLGGGTGNDTVTGLAVDSAGDVYVTGTTTGSLPTTPNALSSAPTTAFAAKLNPDGSQFLYITYLPVAYPPFDGEGLRIAVDTLGNAYITGQTQSD
jgi:hypothetical protein